MSRSGDVYENRVTGEYAVILRGTEDRGDGPGVAHLIGRPGAAVFGEHLHPPFSERFTVLSGALGARIDGRSISLGPGESAAAEAGVPHDWWNASRTHPVEVIGEISTAPGAAADAASRFELLIGTLFGLANDGKVDARGRPGLLQGAVIAVEFADVVIFTSPPRRVQSLLFPRLADLGWALGYRAIDARYARPHRRVTPDPTALARAGLPGCGPSGDVPTSDSTARTTPVTTPDG